ncbi:unnamed protein product [Chrysodeixis includens]|uniref:Uncharacterized protein n=1 Tax=Chrysodeixis includens TaxID=689277 RepID=A0A9P0BZ12_CHRIL|nr:unnamed protein product [Chrysodeixis includens]
MCEIFPEVDTCCYFCSIRVGLLFISVISITTGAVSLGVIEQRSDVGFDKMMTMYSNVSHVEKSTEAALSQLSNMISSAVTAISTSFMFGGLFLLIADLTDQEGIAQAFVLMVFLNVVVGSVLVLAIALECIIEPVCLLGSMDWLSAATCLVMMVIYLVMWFYFICVANSYATHP